MTHNLKLHIIGFGVVCLLTLCTFCIMSNADSGVVNITTAVDSTEHTQQLSNIPVMGGSSYDFLFQVDSNRVSLNNANSLILDIRCRDTIQFSTSDYPVSAGGKFGYVDIRTEVNFADGSTLYSSWVTVDVVNNNPDGSIPRWSLMNENADFHFVFDITDKRSTNIVSVVTYQVFHAQVVATRIPAYSFWIRNQITELSVVYGTVADVQDTINQGFADLNDTIGDSTDKITGSIDNVKDEILNAGSDQSQDVIDNVTVEQGKVTSNLDDLLGLVPVPNVNEIVLSPSVAGGVLAVNQVFDVFFEGLGDKTEATIRLLILCGSVVGVLGLTTMVVGLSKKKGD